MTCFIHQNRYYHLLGRTHNESSANVHKVKYVDTIYGLLLFNSPSNLNNIHGFEKRKEEVRLDSSFMIINSLHDTVVVVEPVGTAIETVVRRFTREEIKNIDEPIIAIGGAQISLFVEAMLGIGNTPRKIYEAMAKSMYVGSNTELFMRNADGICLDELFKHPFAEKEDLF